MTKQRDKDNKKIDIRGKDKKSLPYLFIDEWTGETTINLTRYEDFIRNIKPSGLQDLPDIIDIPDIPDIGDLPDIKDLT